MNCNECQYWSGSCKDPVVFVNAKNEHICRYRKGAVKSVELTKDREIFLSIDQYRRMKLSCNMCNKQGQQCPKQDLQSIRWQHEKWGATFDACDQFEPIDKTEYDITLQGYEPIPHYLVQREMYWDIVSPTLKKRLRRWNDDKVIKYD